MEKIVATYEKEPSYTQHYANGVLGGFDSKGEMVIHFFTETLEFPKVHTYTLENGRTKSSLPDELQEVETDPPDELRFVRNISTSIIMNRQKAESLYEWLGFHLNPNNTKEE